MTYHAPFILADDLPTAVILGAAFLASNRIDISMHRRLLITERVVGFAGRRQSPQWMPFQIALTTPDTPLYPPPRGTGVGSDIITPPMDHNMPHVSRVDGLVLVSWGDADNNGTLSAVMRALDPPRIRARALVLLEHDSLENGGPLRRNYFLPQPSQPINMDEAGYIRVTLGARHLREMHAPPLHSIVAACRLLQAPASEDDDVPADFGAPAVVRPSPNAFAGGSYRSNSGYRGRDMPPTMRSSATGFGFSSPRRARFDVPAGNVSAFNRRTRRTQSVNPPAQRPRSSVIIDAAGGFFSLRRAGHSPSRHDTSTSERAPARFHSRRFTAINPGVYARCPAAWLQCSQWPHSFAVTPAHQRPPLQGYWSPCPPSRCSCEDRHCCYVRAEPFCWHAGHGTGREQRGGRCSWQRPLFAAGSLQCH